MCQRLQDGMGMDACHSCHLLELSRGGATARQTCKRTHRLAHADRSGSINSSGSCFPWMAGLQIFSSSALHCMGPYVRIRTRVHHVVLYRQSTSTTACTGRPDPGIVSRPASYSSARSWSAGRRRWVDRCTRATDGWCTDGEGQLDLILDRQNTQQHRSCPRFHVCVFRSVGGYGVTVHVLSTSKPHRVAHTHGGRSRSTDMAIWVKHSRDRASIHRTHER